MQTSKHPSRSLPAKASAEFLRKEAKRLSKQRGINLVAAQRALAHQYGHRNWAELMAAVSTTVRSAWINSAVEQSDTPDSLQLRDREWSSILDLAQMSLAEMPQAPAQRQWLINRKSFLDSPGIQQQFVAIREGRILGYACVEHPPAWMRGKQEATGQYRLFVVMEPAARGTLGLQLLAKLAETLIGLGARRAWFQEYEAEVGFISFLEEMGFARKMSFRAEDGIRIVRLSMDAPFEPLLRSGGTPAGSRAGGLRDQDPR